MSSVPSAKLGHTPTKGPDLGSPNSNGVTRHDVPAMSISEEQDDPTVRAKYRPFLIHYQKTVDDWVSNLELDTVTAMAREDLEKTGSRLKVLVLYGSLRKRSV